ncbi:Ig-like domain-containing protein [Actinoplanes teichomyceticus]|uniref:Putative repeat protein (TIGR01451 family) n=1 Tax=Actinoplanes teichomyceticus TaxID=1867 RepID=A0A561WQA9_ACTTI|nr:Ig-like domain-containing protein [Actinoplanes teichomyceticus]TWG26056.1 putative repeat protein (TIGR01451 family) [Actinoplanes teichomyceticus]GIF11130.1 hypothetical protein Ate01nite_11620 [Actinoplanes teichomyceticus]
MHRTGAAVLLVCALVLAAVGLAGYPGEAAATAGFALRFEANTNGSILLRGNANLVCSPLALGCPAGRDATGNRLDNNDFSMVAADADRDLTTLNDSTATVALPPGSSVLFAGLYWSGSLAVGSGVTAPLLGLRRDRVRLRTPASTAWQSITATTVHGSGNPYQGFADVTALVAGAGSGVYGVADIQTATGAGQYAGWALAVAYRNPAEVLRALRIYDGLGTVSASSGDVDIRVSGFETPHSGSVRAEVGTVAYEGDLGKRGDALQIDGQPMSDAANPVDNFFNSTATGSGRDPGYANLFGVDIDQFDATDRLGHAVTSATLTLTTTSDTYYPGVVTFAIDLYAPKLVATLTGTDLNGGDLLPGDILEYRVEVRNVGNDVADDTVLSDAIPTYTGYVPGSARIRGSPVADPATPARLDFALGDIPYQGVTYVTFQVRVDPATPPGYAITNLVTLSYTGHTAGVAVSGLAGTAASVVAPAQSDLAAALTVTPAAVQRSALPAAVTYLLTVTNGGPSAEPDARAELSLPAGVAAGPLPAGCTGYGSQVTCLFGPLLPGTRAGAAIPATVQAAATARPSAALRAYGTNTDPVPADNVANAPLRVNLAPRAVADTGTPGAVAVLDNDDDPDGPDSALTVTITTAPRHGSAIVLADRTVEYTPAAGWAGDDTFTYTITDADGGSDSAVVTVRTPNAAPVAVDDAAAVDTGDTVTVPVTANDSDPNGDTLTVTALADPYDGTAGTVTFIGGTITFTPARSFVGIATFTYTVSDGQATATARLAVEVANAIPTAGDDAATVPYLGATTIGVLVNDWDINDDPLSIVSVAAPAHGTAAPSGRNVVYQATEIGFSGTDTFGYTITDPNGGTASALITVTVGNAPPVAVDVSVTTAYLTPAPVDVLTGASDPNPGPTFLVIGASDPAHGVVVRNPDGTLTYTPDPGWSGPDRFTYTLSDGRGGTDTGVVTIDVANAPPVARPESVTLPAGVTSTIDVRHNDEDPNGEPLTVTIDSPPAHGTASVVAGRVVYRPFPGYAGTDTLDYRITDPALGSAVATVTIALVNAGPVARPDTASTPTDTVVAIDLTGNDDDPNDDPLTLTGWTAAAYGTVAAGPGGGVSYTPAPGFTGTDVFAYTVTDVHGVPDTAMVTVVVRNAPPVAVDDTFRVREQGATSLPVIANDRDPNTGQPLSVLSADPPGHGTVTVTGPLTVDYTPAPGTRVDTFDYLLTDDLGGTDTGTVTVTVDLAPAAADDSAETGAGAPVTVDAAANDVDPEGAGLTVSWTGSPAHGRASLQGDNRIRYVPTAGFAGTDTIAYEVRDPIGNTARGRVTVRVRPAPAARPDFAAVRAGRQVDVDVLANDTGSVAGGLTISSVSRPPAGSATLTGGRIRYTAPAIWAGQAEIRYAVTDPLGGTAESTLTVIVTDVTPFAVPDSWVTAYRTAVTVPVLANDLVEEGALRVVEVGRPDHGTAVSDAGRAVVYTPPDGFSGVARFGYTAADDAGHRTSATVTVTVGAPPVAPDRAVTTPPGEAAVIGLPAADSLGRPFAERRITPPAHGTARLNADGSVTYTPDPGFVGEDRFTYEIVDADGNVAQGTIVVTVPPPASPGPSPAVPSSSARPGPSPSRSASAAPRPSTAPAPPSVSPALPVGGWPDLPTTGGPDPRVLLVVAALLAGLGALLRAAGGPVPEQRREPGG